MSAAKEITHIPIPMYVPMFFGSFALLARQTGIMEMIAPEKKPYKTVKTMIDALVCVFGQQKMRIPVVMPAAQNMFSRPSRSAKMPVTIRPKKDAPFKMETKYDASSLLIPCATP